MSLKVLKFKYYPSYAFIKRGFEPLKFFLRTLKMPNLLEFILKKDVYVSNIKLVFNALRNDLITNANRQDDEEFVERYIKFAKEHLINLYEQIIDKRHRRRAFPSNLFKGFQGRINKLILAKYRIEEYLGWDLETLVHKFSKETFDSAGLRSLRGGFDSVYDILLELYPQLKPYYFRHNIHVFIDKNGRKNMNIAKEAIRELVSVYTNLNGRYRFKLKHINKWMNYKRFISHIIPYDAAIQGALACFNNSFEEAIIQTFPELGFSRYHFRRVPKDYWNGKNHSKMALDEAIGVLTDSKGTFRWKRKEILQRITWRTYQQSILRHDVTLGGMLAIRYKNSPLGPFREHYPEVVRKYEALL